MFIWFLLFLAVVAISFVLAITSMGDYHEHPLKSHQPYSLYLIQKPQELTEEILKALHKLALGGKLMFSLERLFKGERSALIIFGPAVILRNFIQTLGLLELEDYSQKLEEDDLLKKITAWEMGIKKSHQGQIPPLILSEALKLQDQEEFWWQIILSPCGRGEKQPQFTTEVRAILQTEDENRLKRLQEEILKVASQGGLTLLPQVYSTSQMIKFYQERTLSLGADNLLNLRFGEILALAGL